MKQASIVVIGAGIIGLATALEILARFPDVRVTVLEKEASVGAHQTGHNSGVIHSGIYYKPGSLKAELCVSGAQRMVDFCIEHQIPHALCGKVIVATHQSELPRLIDLYQRGLRNQLRGIRMLNPNQLREIEPFASGIQGIHVPGTGIVDYKKVAEKMAELLVKMGGTVCLSHPVASVRRARGVTLVAAGDQLLEADLVINCAGLQSDRVSRMTGTEPALQIVPFRGEYYTLVQERESMVRGLIYPVPDPRFPFLGVHFTRRIQGGVEAGPNAVLSLAREGYGRWSFSPSDSVQYTMFPGFWRLAAKHWRVCAGEMYRSMSKKAFVHALQRLMPELKDVDLRPGGSGVRAQAVGRDGKLIDDFAFVFTEGMVHVCNVPSPAATASLAIARHIVDTLVRKGGSSFLQERSVS